MDVVSQILSGVLLDIVYPLMILGSILVLLISIGGIVFTSDPQARIRRMAASVLPLTLLIFSVALTRNADATFSQWAVLDNWVTLLAIGAGIGFLLMESMRWFARQDSELGPVMHVAFLSTVVCFILFCIIQQTVTNLQFFILGMIMASCIHIMLLGTDGLSVSSRSHPEPPSTPPIPPQRSTSLPTPGGLQPIPAPPQLNPPPPPVAGAG